MDYRNRKSALMREAQRPINHETRERLRRLHSNLDQLPVRLPTLGTMAAEVNFFGIPEKLDASEFDGMTGLNPLDMPTHFPFPPHSAMAEKVMNAYMNRHGNR